MILQFFQWCEASPFAAGMRSAIMAPLIEVFHLVGLTMLTGAIGVMSLRLLGLSMTRRSISDVARDLWGWSVFGLVLQLASGAVLFTSESVRWYYSVPFWTKMTLILIGVLFHFTIYKSVTHRDDLQPLAYRLTGVFTLLVWLGVGLGGRALTTL
jgi:hypothetical protein